MDTTDPRIIFNDSGESDHYSNFVQNILPTWNYGIGHEDKLQELADTIKKQGKNKDFDCMIGLSGGLDSSYTAYVAKEIMGLRPLMFHVDAGWNTEQAVANIEKIINGLNLDLYTEVINWVEMKDLQRAVFKSNLPEVDLPQDTAFFSSLFSFAKKNKIRNIVTGANYSTECCREPAEWGSYVGMDKIFINDIHRKHGSNKLYSFPIVDILNYKITYRYFNEIKIQSPLNLVPYIKKDAEILLNEKFGWQKFQHKHHESRFTRFIEDFWLTKKFGFEKRRAHFSSLILTGQMTREEALKRISKPELDESFINKEFEYIAQKLDFSLAEFKDLFDQENRTYKDFKNKKWIIDLGIKAMKTLGLEKRLFR